MDCEWAIDFAMNALQHKIGDKMPLVYGFNLRLVEPADFHGAHVDFDRKEIVANRKDEAMSLSDSEAHLVKQGIVQPGESVSLLPEIADRPWSTLAKELVHESGHILDKLLPGAAYNRLDPSLSPTIYGSKEPHEAFAEAFTYYVFGADITPGAKKVIEETIGQNWGEM